MIRLERKRIAYLVEERLEDLEFWVPVTRLTRRGRRSQHPGTGKLKYVGKQ